MAGNDKQLGKEDADSKRLWGRILIRSSGGAFVPSIVGYAVMFLFIVGLPVLLVSFLPSYGVSAAIILQPAAFFLVFLFFARQGLEIRSHARPSWSQVFQLFVILTLINGIIYFQRELFGCELGFGNYTNGLNDIGRSARTDWSQPCDSLAFAMFLIIYGSWLSLGLTTHPILNYIRKDVKLPLKGYEYYYNLVVVVFCAISISMMAVYFNSEADGDFIALRGVSLIYWMNFIIWGGMTILLFDTHGRAEL